MVFCLAAELIPSPVPTPQPVPSIPIGALPVQSATPNAQGGMLQSLPLGAITSTVAGGGVQNTSILRIFNSPEVRCNFSDAHHPSFFLEYECLLGEALRILLGIFRTLAVAKR